MLLYEDSVKDWCCVGVVVCTLSLDAEGPLLKSWQVVHIDLDQGSDSIKLQSVLDFGVLWEANFQLIVTILNVLVGANFSLILISSELHTSFPSLSWDFSCFLIWQNLSTLKMNG